MPPARGLPPFLFHPDQLAAELAKRPHLKVALGDPHAEGDASEHFSGYRKSSRHIYRVLAHVPVYEHLARLVDSLDFCLGHGYEQPRLLSTRGRAEFSSAVSELQVVEHFVLRDFQVAGFDATKGSDPVPDLRVEGKGLSALIEVYTPREWAGIDDLERDVSDAMKNLDIPFAYRWRADFTQLEDFDRSGPNLRLLFLHPGVLSDALEEDNRRAALVMPLVEELRGRLEAGEETPIRVSSAHPEMNFDVGLAIEEAIAEPILDRPGSFGWGTLSGYAPEAMFERLVKDKVRKKAAKGQARSDASALEILVVDVSRSKIESELRHADYYRPRFEQILKESGTTESYDAVLFCEPARWGQELVTHFAVFEMERVSEAELRKLFGV